MKTLNSMPIILIMLLIAYPCFSLNELDSNKILLDSIILKANTLCKIKLDTAVFNTQRVNFYENEYGKIFYKIVPFSKNDSIGRISFYAVKSPDWQDWKIRLKDSFSKRRTKHEEDSLRDWMANNIDELLEKGCCMHEEEWVKLRRKLDKDSMITDEIKYWNTKK